MRTVRLLSLAAAAALFLLACSAHYTDNHPLSAIETSAGYRYGVVREEPSADRPFVVLSFSGGGTRAAAFAFGLMEELRHVEYAPQQGPKRLLLDDVEVISSVSGGSFTSAYYVLFPERFFAEFPDQVLYRNIQGALIWRFFNPYNWLRFAFPDFSRIDMADEYYGSTIFQEKSYADLLSKPKGSVPFLVLNATDISIAHRFEFTQDQFDLLCSDLSGVPISRAVAASSNFPVAFAPLTVNIFQKDCGPLPGWIDPALADDIEPGRRYADARAASSYRDPSRRYAHLLDGGLSDNLGLRGPYQAFATTDSSWSTVTQANRSKLGRLMVITANAKTTKHNDWDEKSTPPGIREVLGVVTGGPMDDVSFDSVENTDRQFKYMEQLSDTVDACNEKLAQDCPGAEPISNPIQTEFSFAELSFDRVRDKRLRRCLEGLPTSFSLPRETVDLLRVTAAQLLMTSEPFIRGMQDLDPAWKPREVVIDKKLIEEVCGE
jgi:NTE family protein